ncbi:innexin inx2-like [Ornithodoros turicata]|uniref:innexin inx2-like n=1 Tax=Ornithodoros turicata TaxID=34597 RepID=UPI003138E4D6
MTSLLLTDTFKNLVRFSTVRTDNNVFRLHYRFTGVLLFTASVLVSATQFFGNPIYCVTHDIIPKKVMNTYCWIEGTVTLSRSLNKTVGKEVAAPGVDQMRITDADAVIEHAYYQWVCFVLFLQALMFYFPRWLWRSWERGRMRSLILEMNKPVIDASVKEYNIGAVVSYFMRHRSQHQSYAWRYLFCEVLNLVNVLGQIFFINKFLGGMFTTYGTDVIRFVNEDPAVRYDPMTKIFPKMTKCRFHRFGTSGDVQKHDSICLLPLNIINEKVYIFLWFWLIVLAVVSALDIIYRAVVCRFPRYRYLLLRALSRMVNPSDMDQIVRKAHYGDWFVLYLLKDNMQALFFRDVVAGFAKKLRDERHPDYVDGEAEPSEKGRYAH